MIMEKNCLCNFDFMCYGIFKPQKNDRMWKIAFLKSQLHCILYTRSKQPVYIYLLSKTILIFLIFKFFSNNGRWISDRDCVLAKWISYKSMSYSHLFRKCN